MLVRKGFLWSWGRSFLAVLPSGATIPFPHHYLLAHLSAPLSTDQPILEDTALLLVGGVQFMYYVHQRTAVYL